MERNRPKHTSRSFARSPQQIDRARELRQTATEAEKIAWRPLRGLRQKGFPFRRQQPVGKCVVDFCCLEQRLIVELDGSVHAQPSQAGRDAKRDEWLRALGYRVARFPNGIVLDAPEEFVERVLRLANESNRSQDPMLG
jgi:very-short-patch-repair endonuclease